MYKKDLITPLFALYNFESLSNINFKESDSEYLKNSYDLKERKEIYDALKWAEENSTYQFESIMKDAPVIGKLKFNNDEVYQYLMSFKAFMENSDYNLLTDDRATNLPWDN